MDKNRLSYSFGTERKILCVCGTYSEDRCLELNALESYNRAPEKKVRSGDAQVQKVLDHRNAL